MYKKVSYEELIQLKTNFFDNLLDILKKEKGISREPFLPIKDYIATHASQGPTVYHINRQECVWKTTFVNPREWQLIFYDERSKLELHTDKVILAKIASLLKDSKKLAAQKEHAISMEEILIKAFDQGHFADILGKDYIVYDIETALTSWDLSQTEFYLGYAYIVSGGKGEYREINVDNLAKFVDYLQTFDGYIIWYNNIGFDNQVIVHEALKKRDNWSLEEYKRVVSIIDDKSLDLFLFIWEASGKRMKLNDLSTALVGVEKTLESWAEGEGLWKQYLEGNLEALQTLKEYCKNDVKMTYLCLRYILHFQKLTLKNQTEYTYTIGEFVEQAQPASKTKATKQVRKNMFSDTEEV